MKKYFLTFVVAAFLSLIPLETFAAKLHFGETTAASPTKVILYVDAANSVNAFDITVRVPKIIAVSNISDGSSMIKFWTQSPVYDREKGTVTFSGIVPNGFKGEHGALLSFDVSTAVETKIDIISSSVLLNDSFGTADTITTSSLTLTPGAGEPAEVVDTEIPEHFVPVLTQDPLLFEGRAVLIFKTEDKISGIDRYEVLESSSRKLTGDEVWTKAESPYVLKDQALKSYIHIRAVDRVGNIRSELVYPQSFLASHKAEIMWGIIILLILFAFSLWIKRRKG
jgi:hypothetical protein